MSDQEIIDPEAQQNHIENLPMLALRDVVVYPHMVIPLFIGRDKSVKALEDAMNGNKRVLLVAQKESSHDNPTIDDLYKIGTVSRILQLLKLPDSTIKVLVEGVQRGKLINCQKIEPFFMADVMLTNTQIAVGKELEILNKSLVTQFESYVKLNKRLPSEIVASLLNINDPIRLVDTIAAHLLIKTYISVHVNACA